MTNKINQSLAIKRQIPEHIRDNYPLFVDFLKTYYEFLQQTQTQNLEQIRSIDDTLEEFIERFKSELSKNLPVNLARDKRMLLRHLREFYLSRGSEASYKFLFRTLFDKESELFYPSTQILRVSDGKWNQEVSIFVKMTSDTDSLFEFKGNFVNIESGQKTIQTYVPEVILYSNTTYEVFIQRDYLNQINVGDVVKLTSGTTTYSGVIQKCPTKVSIYKKGKGFKPGDIFSLKTNLGPGCLIKITKTDSDGGILAIQVVRFSLDYETTFWSYLSNKGVEGFEFIHPLTLNWAGPGDPPAYNENSGGYTEFGFATKQNYMFYDENIPAGSDDLNSDRYYVDSSYVGDIVGQFYEEQRDKVLDEDLAIIQIDLGAVAKYPGYYSTQDGFISDEMFIHDGKYYQAFSYVIRVEEELRKYTDLVKSILHPAGMKMYAEYSIFNQLSLTFSPSVSFENLLFADSISNIEDRGYSYSNYISSIDSQGNIIVEPALGASQVFSDNGKIAIRPIKTAEDFITQFLSICVLSLAKQINLFITNSDTSTNSITKKFPSSSSTGANLDYVTLLETFSILKGFIVYSTTNPIDSYANSVSMSPIDTQSLIDSRGVYLNSFSSELYFDIQSDYQTSAP